MTEKRCKDCKHTRGISFDFWCGAGHTKYERVFGTTDCPYFEYHDWSKGTPSRTEKRFIKEEKMIHLGDGYITIGSGADKEKIPIEDISVKGSDIRNLDDEQICGLLNNLADENEQLKKDLNEYCNFSLHAILDKKNKEIEKLKSICKDHRDHAIDFKADCVRLEKENEELKLLVQGWEALDEEKDRQLDNQNQALKKLKKENEKLKVELNKLEEDLDYYKTKCASLETGLLQAQRDVEWLRDNTVWEQMPSSKRTVTKTFK